MLSVVIATLDNERALVRTLSALVPAAATGVVREVIIADGGSSDDTLEVADIAGCTVDQATGPLAQRLTDAATKARADWLMFLRPGAVLEHTWADEVAQFARQMEMLDNGNHRAATFRKGVSVGGSTTMFAEAISMLRASFFGSVGPEQGLVIARPHYQRLGGHKATADTEHDLLARIGKRRIVRLHSGATMLKGT